MAIDWTMSTLRGEVLNAAAPIWSQITRGVKLCTDPKECESLFKEAHLGIKRTILVSTHAGSSVSLHRSTCSILSRIESDALSAVSIVILLL